MKKPALIITVLLGLLACAQALAMTQEEWDRGCTWKTRCATTIYQLVATPTDLGEQGVLTPAGSIPAGTYLGSRQLGFEGMSEMGMMLNGRIVDYFVPAEALMEAVRTIALPDGRTFSVPELAYGQDEAVREYLRWSCDAAEMDEVLQAMHGVVQAARPAGISGSDSNTERPLSSVWQATLLCEDGSTEAVGVVTLGSCRSVILRGGTEETVPTATLSFGLPADAACLVAVVATRSTGYLSLRTGAYKNAPSQARIPDGTLVAVIGQDGDFTQVSWNGLAGYVVASGLTLLDVTAQPLAEGTLFQRGKRETSIFLSPKQGAKWLAKWPQGTPVTIVDEQGKYYEVEKDGLRGWLKKDYVQIAEP